jgi:predicted DNA-binding transcriptional regulator AlpA
MDDTDAFSILEFCRRHGISRSAFYNALKANQGPRLMKVGNRVMISREAAEAWRREREEATAQSA